ncbi:hypothetical protein EI555_021066 [Monodon monoceros]|uniref:Uncharacterized protein n=1 Tax=Monodon monoceros TaxID=40151 RepID=A0A4U1EN26_MONMO|nr:hypothetical protein EI555_021066 [Monodon monoceros]
MSGKELQREKCSDIPPRSSPSLVSTSSRPCKRKIPLPLFLPLLGLRLPPAADMGSSPPLMASAVISASVGSTSDTKAMDTIPPS